MKFDCHRKLRRHLGYHIQVPRRAQSAEDGSNTNRFLDKLLNKRLMRWRLADPWTGPSLARGLRSSDGMPVNLDTGASPPTLGYLKRMSIYHSVYPKRIYALDTVMRDDLIRRIDSERSNRRGRSRSTRYYIRDVRVAITNIIRALSHRPVPTHPTIIDGDSSFKPASREERERRS